GKADPLRAWIVEAVREGRTRLEAGAQRGLTPLIGRQRELEALDAAFARAGAGQGQVVFVVGEPGIGKSRLLYEFRGRTGAADRRPQIVVIEDLHWIDRATEEFLAVLGDSVPASRVLLIFTYRPGYAQPFGERTYHTRIVPAPLSEPESAHMAAAILSSGALPERLRSAIAAKAEGNPFYVEEVVRSLHETGAIRVEDGRFVLAAR